jgi:hypothetical protein
VSAGFDNWDILIGRPYTAAAPFCGDPISYVKLNYNCQLTVKEYMRYTYDHDAFRLIGLLIIVYMPYECNNNRTDDFADELLTVEDLINNNNDCHSATQSLAAIST